MLRTNGVASLPLEGHVVVTFGDDCPGGCLGGIAVHQAVIPLVDDGGDVVMPQYYALCCACHQRDFERKYGFDSLQPCGCDDVDLQKIARALRQETLDKAAAVEAGIAAWREDLRQQRAAGVNGTVTELGAYVGSGPVVVTRE